MATFLAQQGSGPWGVRSWGGLLPPAAAPTAGIVLSPQPTLGVMRVQAWWADATQLLLTRVSTDGVRTPVRGGTPVSVMPTRRNYCTNPSVETNTTGWSAGTGTPTLSRIARTGEPTAGSWALRAQVAGAGTNEVNVPHSLPAQQVTVAFDLRLSALPSGVTVSLGWNNSTGGALTASSVALTTPQYTASVGAYSRQMVLLAPPAGAATATTLKITTSGMSAGGQMDLDRVLAEVGISDGAYFDGGTDVSSSWTGTAHASTSVLPPLVTVDDGECPLDVSVTYEVSSPIFTGGRLQSDPATLASEDRVWLTHPEDPGAPVQVNITVTPERRHVLEQGVFPILDSPYPVVVSTSTRLAPSGAVEFLTESWDQRDQIIHDLFGSGTPVLLRSSPGYGNGEGEWVMLGTIVENPLGQKASRTLRTLSADFQVVERPSLVA